MSARQITCRFAPVARRAKPDSNQDLIGRAYEEGEPRTMR